MSADVDWRAEAPVNEPEALDLDEYVQHVRSSVATEDQGAAATAPSLLPDALDWFELWARESKAEWLVEDFWPAGRQLHIFAPRKAKKSLVTLWTAACLAGGIDPFSGDVRDPVDITYLDHEMTEDDVLERLEAMGFAPQDLSRLHYYLLPTMPPLDTFEGGDRLMQLVQRDGSSAVIIDTLSRVVEGEENSNDTYQSFYLYTGRRLKQAGIALARLDHEGHEAGRSRGASAKADDVDVVWRLQATEDGVEFIRKASRVSWVPESVQLRQREDPLSFGTGLRSWPAGTKTKAMELDQVNAPLNIGRRAAADLLKQAGVVPGRNDVLAKALKYRQMFPHASGTNTGTTP